MAPLQSVLRSPKQAAWVRSVLTLDLIRHTSLLTGGFRPASHWRSAKDARAGSEGLGRGKEKKGTKRNAHRSASPAGQAPFPPGSESELGPPCPGKTRPAFHRCKDNKIPAPTVNHPQTKSSREQPVVQSLLRSSSQRVV